MTDREKYIKELEETIAKFMAPLKGIPFPIVIQVLSGHKVLPFDETSRDDRSLLSKMERAAATAGKNAFNKGILAKRPNEAGNYIEPFVIDALQEVGLKADTPLTNKGTKKATGYPDIQITDPAGRVSYLECKTYNLKSRDTTFRSFYLSPSKEDFKVTKDGRHFMMSFQLEQASRSGRSVFVPVHWGIYDLSHLKVAVKHEFNASNRDLYQEGKLLAEGDIR